MSSPAASLFMPESLKHAQAPCSPQTRPRRKRRLSGGWALVRTCCAEPRGELTEGARGAAGVAAVLRLFTPHPTSAQPSPAGSFQVRQELRSGSAIVLHP